MTGTAKTPAEPPEPLFRLEAGLTLVDLWLNLESGHKSWPAMTDAKQRDRVVNSARLMLDGLKEVPVRRWLAFNHAIGWIEPACVAASWCQGAQLGDVIAVWNAMRFSPEPEPGMDFPARLINPQLLPPDWDFTQIMDAGGRQLGGVMLLVAARDDAPAIRFNDPESYFRQKCPPDLARMLALRGAIPATWIGVPQQAGAAATPEKPAQPQLSAQEMHRRSFEARVAALLPKRKEARGWTDEDVEAALASGEGVSVYGPRVDDATRHVLPGVRRSVVADGTGLVIHVGRDDYVYSDTVERLPEAEFPPMVQPRDRMKIEQYAGDYETLYMPLRDEFVKVWRPVSGLRLGEDVFFVRPLQQAHDDEAWAFANIPYVICEARVFGGRTMPVVIGREVRR